MAYYRLRDRYALRRYKNGIPKLLAFTVKDGEGAISEEDLHVLKKCDGETEMEMNPILERYVKQGFVEKLDAPNPVIASRRYREFNHKRMILAIWAITKKCNLNCIHCVNITGGYTGEKLEATLEDAETIVKRLSDFGIEMVKLFGGEPFVHPHFMEIVRLITKAGINLSMIDTNGLLLDEKMLDEIEETGAKPHFYISFDGLGTHDWMRNRPGCEEKTLRAIKLCVDREFPVTVAINVNKRTLPVLYKTIHYLMDMGCREVKLLRTSEVMRWQETEKEAGESLTISTKEFALMLPDIVKDLMPDIRKGMRITLFNSLTIHHKISGEDLLQKKTVPPQKCSAWCGSAGNGVFVSADGHVIPCLGLEPILQYKNMLGDEFSLLKKDLYDILYSKTYQDLFGISQGDILWQSSDCRKCNRWNICRGGSCRLNALNTPEWLQSGMPVEKEYLAGKDIIGCFMQREGVIDKIAKIIDEN